MTGVPAPPPTTRYQMLPPGTARRLPSVRARRVAAVSCARRPLQGASRSNTSAVHRMRPLWSRGVLTDSKIESDKGNASTARLAISSNSTADDGRRRAALFGLNPHVRVAVPHEPPARRDRVVHEDEITIVAGTAVPALCRRHAPSATHDFALPV